MIHVLLLNLAVKIDGFKSSNDVSAIQIILFSFGIDHQFIAKPSK